MFIIFNKDGSIFAKTQSDYVMQGSNRVNKVYVGFVDNDYYQWTCNGVFNLPNGTRWTVPGISVREGFDYLGVNYKGWTIDLTDDITKYDGKVSLTIQVVNSDTAVLFTYLANITINRTGLPIDGYWDNSITVAQFNDYMAQLAVKLQANTVSVVVSENDLPDVGEKNILYFVVGESSNTPYQVKMWNGSEYVLLGTINLSSFASKEEQELFENAINEQIAQIRNEVVNPFVVVATESDLPSTDEGKIYVVVDTESWYYWNGSAYVNGGTFAQVSLDAINVSYNGTESGLYANNVQSAIDELVVEKLDKDGYSALAHVGLADNIASPDGITDNAEFAFRASGGTASIADGFAEIKRLKGRTWIVNQLIKNYEFSTNTDWSFIGTEPVWGTNKITLSTTRTGNEWSVIYQNRPTGKEFVAGNKYFFSIKCSKSSNLKMRIRYPAIVNLEENEYIFVANQELQSLYIQFQSTDGAEASVEITQIKVVDLTKMFGAGKEPSTVSQFNNLTRNINLDAYNEGTFVNMNAEALESTGFNAFDGELDVGYYWTKEGTKSVNSNRTCSKNKIKVVSGQKYTLTTEGCKWEIIYVFQYDKNGNVIPPTKTVSLGGLETNYTYYWYTPDPVREITLEDNTTELAFFYEKSGGVVLDNPQICFHLTHSGYRNGQYEPYMKNTRTFYDVETYFPSGMRSAGSAFDEMTPKRAVQNIGVYTFTGNEIFVDGLGAGKSLSMPLSGAKKPSSNNDIANILWNLGTTTNVNSVNDKTEYSIALSTSGMLYITTTKTSSELAQAIKGKTIYFELAEPIIYDIDTDEEWTYPVSDFGTEKAVDGAFLSADIFYMNNLRDKLRNLPDIPKCSETGTHVLKCINGTYTWVEE